MSRNIIIGNDLANAVQEAGSQMTQIMPMLGGVFSTLAAQIRTLAFTMEQVEQRDILMGRGVVARAMQARDQMDGINPPRSYAPHRLNAMNVNVDQEATRRSELRPFLESIRCFLLAGGELDFGTSSVVHEGGYLSMSGVVAHGAFRESISVPLYPSTGEPAANYISMWEDIGSTITVSAGGIDYSYLVSDILMRFGTPCCPFVEPIPEQSITEQLLTKELFLISKHKCSFLVYSLETNRHESSKIQFMVEDPDGVNLSLRILHRGKIDDINGFKSHARDWRTEISDNVKWDNLPYYLQHLIADWLPGAITEQLDNHAEFLLAHIKTPDDSDSFTWVSEEDTPNENG